MTALEANDVDNIVIESSDPNEIVHLIEQRQSAANDPLQPRVVVL